MPTFILRPYQKGDAAATLQLFYDTIHTTNLADYTKAQVDAWAPKDRDAAAWGASLEHAYAFVATTDTGEIAGFADLAKAPHQDGGYFDRLYAHKNFLRMGVATLLADAVEAQALRQGYGAIYTDASITAKPFFAGRGYIELSQNAVKRGGELLVNFTMRKGL